MKMTITDYTFMDNTIQDYLRQTGQSIADMYRVYKAQGLSDTRFNWDLITAAGLTRFLCDTLYKYLNDDHIDTAINKITQVKHRK